MKAVETNLLSFLKKSTQFVIPIYQRTYSWKEKQCQQLWDDILRTGSSKDISAHFLGSIVYIEKDIYQISSQSSLLVIDGQQRLTTVTLIIAALAKELDQLDENKREPLKGFSPKKLRNYYLLNPEEEDDMSYKLILSQTDKDSLTAILDNREQPKDYSVRITENFSLFEKWIHECKDDLTILCNGLNKLIMVDIALHRGQDNPQLIFESMNSTGKELNQADLIRNYILMGLEPHIQTKLYKEFWHPMEEDFGQNIYTKQFDSFMRHYLTVKTREIPKIDDVYDSFKAYANSTNTKNKGIEKIVADIRIYSHYYCAMKLGKENNTKLEFAFNNLRNLKVDVAYPFLLELYHDYENKILSTEEFIKAIKLVESYVFRRAICSIPTNSLNKTFAKFTKDLQKDRYIENIQAHFLLLPSYRRFPNDEEFQRELQNREIYNSKNCSYLLRRLENYRRKESVLMDEYTIEHIMPQTEKLSQAWKHELGPEWEKVHEKWLHTLGNLTLTGYNSEYNSRPFKEKRDMEGGFKVSPLNLNKGIGLLDHWNEQTITERASRLANIALKIWAAPKLGNEILEKYKNKDTKFNYTIEDHPYIHTGTMHNLFEAFRKEVLAIDPCVTEEFLKLYVAYKAETNFVDVVSQSKRLSLSLNMPFSEVNDPKGLCKDVSNVGRWGNGDVKVDLSSMDDLPYVMGLIRQSFEQQMGNGDES